MDPAVLQRLETGDEAVFAQLVAAVMSTDNAARKAAEDVYKGLLEKRSNVTVRLLVGGLAQAAKELRAFCIVMLRKVRWAGCARGGWRVARSPHTAPLIAASSRHARRGALRTPPRGPDTLAAPQLWKPYAGSPCARRSRLGASRGAQMRSLRRDPPPAPPACRPSSRRACGRPASPTPR